MQKPSHPTTRVNVALCDSNHHHHHHHHHQHHHHSDPQYSSQPHYIHLFLVIINIFVIIISIIIINNLPFPNKIRRLIDGPHIIGIATLLGIYTCFFSSSTSYVIIPHINVDIAFNHLISSLAFILRPIAVSQIISRAQCVT